MEKLSATNAESWLSWFFRGILILGFLILLSRLFDLQIIKGAYYKSLSEGNRIRRVPIASARGQILGRGGEVLVGSKEVKKRIIFDPDEGFTKTADFSVNGDSETITEWIRDYKLGEELGHVVGYVGEVNQEELSKVRAECPEKGPRRLGSLVGRMGLEKMYDCTLTGIDGEEMVEVDAFGNKVRILGKRQPRAGEVIKTTIDIGLQKKIYESMRGKKGAVVAMNPKGEVLALYSSPSFDPNIFVVDKDGFKVQEVLVDTDLPLFNRAVGGMFHPGSVYKPIVALAALEEGEIDDKTFIEDTGKIVIETPYGTFTYTNWYFNQYGGVEGKIDLVRAIARSTDTFFYKLGENLGVEKMNSWSTKFGLDEKTGIDIPGEISGLIPSPQWNIDAKGERWFLGNTYHMSIGQGDIALTPLAVNTAISAIASDGEYCTPYIVERELDESKCQDLGIKKESIDLVKKGMNAACSNGGTGFTFFDFKEKSGIEVACKTGTAETERADPHAWFTAFAPVEEPEIAVTVLVENGGEGSRVAGPIAREIFNYWFNVQPTPTQTPTPDK